MDASVAAIITPKPLTQIVTRVVAMGFKREDDLFIAAWEQDNEKKSQEWRGEIVLPFEDGQVELISAWDVLQFMGDTYKKFMLECCRVLCPGGILSVRVPEFPCYESIIYPEIKRYFMPFSFDWLGNNLYPLLIEHSEINTPEKDLGVSGRFRTNLQVELRKPDPDFDAEVERRKKELIETATTVEQRDKLRIM